MSDKIINDNFKALVREIAELKAENERLESAKNSLFDVGVDLTKRLDALRTAFKLYGQHHDWCNSKGTGRTRTKGALDYTCSCGFDAAKGGK